MSPDVICHGTLRRKIGSMQSAIRARFCNVSSQRPFFQDVAFSLLEEIVASLVGNLYFARPELTHLTLSHTNPKRKRGCEWRPRLHFRLVSVTAARSIKTKTLRTLASDETDFCGKWRPKPVTSLKHRMSLSSLTATLWGLLFWARTAIPTGSRLYLARPRLTLTRSVSKERNTYPRLHFGLVSRTDKMCHFRPREV